MPVLPFYPEIDGFRFDNQKFVIEEDEVRQYIDLVKRLGGKF